MTETSRDIVEELRHAAAVSRVSADNGSYLCCVTIDQAERAAADIERLRKIEEEMAKS